MGCLQALVEGKLRNPATVPLPILLPVFLSCNMSIQNRIVHLRLLHPLQGRSISVCLFFSPLSVSLFSFMVSCLLCSSYRLFPTPQALIASLSKVSHHIQQSMLPQLSYSQPSSVFQ